jgi:hypothetical protein
MENISYSILFLLALFSSTDSRIVYDTPSPVYSANSPSVTMAQPKTEQTYRFSASVETRPGECEADTTLYFIREYTGTGGMPGVQRQEITIRKKGGMVTGVFEIPASTFRVKAGSRIAFRVEYGIGGRCKARPTYQVWPVLEQIEKKEKH